MSSRLQRLFLAGFALAAVLVGTPRGASAQTTTTGTTGTTTATTITIYQEQSLPRYNAGHTKQVQKRGLQYTPEGVNYQDCIDGQEIELPIQMSGIQGNGSVQIWASLNGLDCSAVTARSSLTQQCWDLHQNFQPSINTTVWIPVREIMAGASPNSPTATKSDPSICGLVDLNTIQVQILYFAPGNLTQAAASQAVSIQVDTVGPAPPTGIHTLPGDTRIYVKWDNISGEGGLTSLTGVKVYCDQNGNTSVPNVSQCATVLDAGVPGVDLSQVGEAGTTATTTDDASTTHSNVRDDTVDGGDAGDDGGDASSIDVTTTTSDAATTTTTDSSSSTCSNANFVLPNGDAVVPNAAFDSCFLCGSITGNTGTSVTATGFRGSPLVNNTHYAVAVAATDAFENVGLLSPISCEYPEETNDFWRTYKADGGGAGGCDTGGEPPLGSLGALGAMVAIGVSVVRRRKRSSR